MTLDSFPNRRTVLTAGSALMFGATLSPWELRAQTSSGKPIGTIGAGYIGSTIGGLWVKNGHKVLFSSRHPEELKDLVSGLGPLAQAGTVDQAIAFGDVVLLTVPYGAVPQIGRDYATQLNGKIVLDTCNAGPGDGALAAPDRPSPRRSAPTARLAGLSRLLSPSALLFNFEELVYNVLNFSSRRLAGERAPLRPRVAAWARNGARGGKKESKQRQAAAVVKKLIQQGRDTDRRPPTVEDQKKPINTSAGRRCTPRIPGYSKSTEVGGIQVGASS